MKKYLILSFMLLPFIGLSQDILISEGGTVNTCSGTLFDSGGGSGNYSSNENYSITICPDNPGQNIELDFTSFSTQLNADILTIYDGPDNTGTGTTYSGNATQSPGFITATNASGCITVEFFSNAAANTTGFAANISCYEPCQEIIGSIDSVFPEPNAEGQVTVCPGEEVIFTASGEFSNSSEGATFAWEFGDGTTAEGLTVSKVYDQSGIFSAGLVITDTNPLGCSSLQITQIVIVAPSIDFAGTEAGKTELCFGDSTTLFGVAESTQLEDCAPEIFEQTWLEDTQTTGQQASYESTISVECYADGLEFTDVSQLIQICVVIEHSFIGDLDMLLTAPNGQSVYFAQYGDGNDPGTSLGIPDELDNGNPGTGFEYCFTPDSTADISSTGGTTVPAGIYGASNGSSFTDLLGTSLNGDWTFTVIDSWAADDGTIFSWNLDFDPALSAPPSEIISQVWLDDPSIVSVEGNNIVVSPTESGEICYTYVVQDDFGCEYSETICINVEEEIVTEQAINLYICDPLTSDLFFDFTENESLISSIATDPDNLIISFYESEEDAENEVNSIVDYINYPGLDEQTIYVRVEYLESNCYETQSFTLNVTDPPLVNPVDKLFICDDETDDGFVDYDLNNFNSQILGDQVESDYLVSYYLTYDDAYNGTNALEMPYEISNNSVIWPRVDVIGTTGCFNIGESDLLSFQVNPPDDSSFEMTPTCDGASANITGFFGGTFAFDTAPTDGAIIDSSTGTITGGDYNTTYSVGYTTAGGCPTTTIVSVTSVEDDDSSFEMTSTCDGAAATVTGLVGGTFAFDTAPTDGAVIDSSTGTITGGDYDTTYSVSYTTNGDCPTTTIVSITSIIADDSSFEMTSTCDGAAATVTGLVGGTFAFDTAPTDGAVIDSSTGTITGGDYDTTYSVSYTTNGDCPTTTIVSITSIIADDSSFEMTSTCDGGTATVTGLVGGTFAFDTAPTDGAVIDSSTGTVSQGGYGVDYIISYTTNGDCPTSSIVNFSSAVLPVISDPTPFEVCDDNIADGFVEMDLSIKNSEITNGNSNYAVTYYLTSEDATTADNPLTLPYTNISNPQTVFIRVVDIIYGCFVTTSMELNVQSAPAANTPSILEYCDADADGFGVFDLTNADAEITSGQTGLVITYHETQADAENNVNAITGNYNNIVQYQQTIYVRVESATITTTCATYLELLIVVNDVPQIETEPSALEVCDNDTDGFGLFDLSLASEEILNGLDPLDFEVTYYETSENATLGENPIATPLAYTNVSPFTQDIYVRVENIATECYNTTALTLIVNELPVLIQPDPLELCDDNNTGDEVEEFTLEDSLAQVLNGQTGISITFHETQEDADNADAPIFSPYTNIVNAQTIYLRAENDITGCVSTITLDLRVNPLPSPVTVEPLEACDVDADGFTSFDLESVSEDIINGELDIFITYYETLTDAENALNPLASPYDNIVPNQQTLFVRAENSITGCFSVVDLELISLPSPQLPIVIDDIIICDDDLNGFFQFDLTQNTALILGDQVASEFNLSYHISQEDADTGDNPIVNPETYSNLSNPQTIYVRLESIENLCVSTGEFDLIVSLPPDAIQPLPLEICDDIVADETTVFDLTVKDEEITGGNPWIVEYFETEEDAMANTNVIADPEAYTNTVVGTNALNPQTLFVRVTDPSTTCYSFVTLTIRVLPNPTPSIDPANIELCDYDTSGDELEVFDITVNEAYIINGEEGVSVTYHETQEDAELGENAIVDPAVYTNITLGQQIIYVRVTNDITACYTIVTFDLIVNPLPDISAADQYIACEIDTDGFFDFDLDTVSASILGTQDPLNFTVTYHETQEDADNGDNVLVSPYTNLTNPQQLFVNITNNTTGCFIAVPSITIEVQEAAQANSDLDRIEYIICDNLADNDGFGTFNLSSQNEEILDGQDPANFTVTYYDNQIDAELGTNPLANSYENTSNPQIIYARVDNDTTADAQCYATTDLTLIVNLLPEFFLEDVYLGCVNVNGSELLDPVVMDIGLDPALYSFEWFDPTGTLVSTSVTYTPLVGGTFTAIATNLATGCQNTVTTLVDPSSPPEVSAVVTTEFFADLHVIQASATGEGIYEFSLDDGPWQTSGTFEDVTPGFHSVIARDINGCGTGTTQVLVIDYPHFFTPNGDGYNDTWRVEGIETRPLAKIYIYDRFGKLLKQLSPLGPGWDGTFNGENLPATDYWFTIRLDVVFGEAESVIKEFTGHFSLKR